MSTDYEQSLARLRAALADKRIDDDYFEATREFEYAANPDTIRALIAERDALKAVAERWRSFTRTVMEAWPNDGADTISKLIAERDALKANAERLRAAIVRADLQIGDGHIEAARRTLDAALGE